MTRLTRHALEMIGVRQIALAWVEAAVASPDKVAADPVQAGVMRSFKVIEAAGGRVLRVAHRQSGADVLVITTGAREKKRKKRGEKITSERTEEVAPGILLDFDAAGRVVGIEVLNVHSRMTALSAAA